LTVAGHGLVVEPEQPAAMAAAVLRLVEQPDLRSQLGAEARRFAEVALNRETVLRQFETDLRECSEDTRVDVRSR
jgi:colanic acid biosynthesis glycosyl transferase WcaI